MSRVEQPGARTSADRALPSRLESIWLLRGVAALAVVAYHSATFAPPPPDPGAVSRLLLAILGHGHVGVPLFFVISGFCIHLRWARRYHVDPAYQLAFGSFWRRRIHRLYPPYLVVLLLSMGAVVGAWVIGLDVPLLAMYPAPKVKWISLDFASHLVMLHGLHPLFDRGGGNGVFWTLAREEYFYLLYFPLLAARRRWGLRPTVLGVLVLGLLFPYLFRSTLEADSAWWLVVNTSAFVLWIQWVLGMVAVEAAVGLVRVPRIFSRSWMIAGWGVLALIADSRIPSLSPLLWGLTFFGVVLLAVDRELSQGWSVNRLVRWLGGVGVFSYSLYLIHYLVRSVLKQLLIGVVPPSSWPVFWTSAVVLGISGYCAGRILFILVERRFISQPVDGARELQIPVAHSGAGYAGA